VTIAGSATDPVPRSSSRATPVDVLFLDIQAGPDRLRAARTARSRRDRGIHDGDDRYASTPGVNSLDYLLKPIEADRLEQTLDKVERFAGQARHDVRALERELAAHLAPNRRLERIASRVGERTAVLDVARVSHFTSKDKLTFAVVNGHEHVIDQTLSDLESSLDPRRFTRIHRATIVNLGFVQELFPAVDGGVLVRLRDETKTELSVARDRVRALKGRLGI
jgi:two-component system LytT family response regulator